MKWSDVENSYSFINLDDEKKDIVRNRYWQDEVKPSQTFQQFNEIGEAPTLYQGIFKKQYKYDGNDTDININTPEQMKRVNMAFGVEASGTTPEERKQIQERMGDVHYQESRGYLQELSDEWTLGQVNTDLGYLQGVALWERDLTPEEQAEVTELKDQAQRLNVSVKGRSLGTKMLYSFANIIPLMARSVGEGIKTGLAGAAAGAAVGSVVPGLGTLVGAGKGYLYGQIAGSSKFMAYVEGGSAYDEMLEMGIDDKTAKPIAMGIGVVNAALEMAQWATIAKTIPGASAFIKNGVKLTGKGIAKKIVKDGAGRGLAEKLLSIGGKFAGTGVTEIGQEVLQENVTLWGTEIGKHIQNEATNAGIDPVTAGEYWERMRLTVEGSLGMFLMGFPGSAVATGKAVNEYSKDKRILAENETVEDIEDGIAPEEALQQAGEIELEGQPQTIGMKQDSAKTKAQELQALVTAEGFGTTPESIVNAKDKYEEIQKLSGELQDEGGLADIKAELYDMIKEAPALINEAQAKNDEVDAVLFGKQVAEKPKETAKVEGKTVDTDTGKEVIKEEPAPEEVTVEKKEVKIEVKPEDITTKAPDTVVKKEDVADKEDENKISNIANISQKVKEKISSMNREEYVQEKDMDKSKSGETSKPTKNVFKSGDMAIEGYGGEHIYIMEYIDPNEIDYTEKEMSKKTVLGWRETKKYIEWFVDGIEPMPITVIYNTPSKTYKTINRRRLLAAREAGVKVPAWIEIGKRSDIIKETVKSKPFPASTKKADLVEEKKVAKKKSAKPKDKVTPEPISESGQIAGQNVTELNDKKKALEQSRDSVDKFLPAHHEEQTLLDEIKDELGLSFDILSIKHLNKLKKDKEFTPEQRNQIREIEKNTPISQKALVELRKSRKADFQAQIDAIDKELGTEAIPEIAKVTKKATKPITKAQYKSDRESYRKTIKNGRQSSFTPEILTQEYIDSVRNDDEIPTTTTFLNEMRKIYGTKNITPKESREIYYNNFPKAPKFRTPQLTEQGRVKVKKEYGKLSLPERKAVSRNITKILDKVLGKGNYNFNLVNQIKQNIKAVGAQYDNTIEILEGIPDSRDTALHETVHFVMRNTLTSQQRNQVFGLLKEQFGSEMDNVELEEIFAEGLIKWVNATDKQKAQMNFSDRIKAWFDKIIESMRKLFTNEDSVWNSVNDFYADLYSGKLQDTQASPFKTDTKAREINQQAKNVKEVRDKEGKLLAPNGAVSNLNELQWKQVRTRAFKGWFGNWQKSPDKASKVVDENGEPMVVYHGSAPTTDFSVFKATEYRDKLSFFTPSQEQAGGWAYLKSNRTGTGERIYPVFIGAKKIFDYRNKTDIDFFINHLKTIAKLDDLDALHGQYKKNLDVASGETESMTDVLRYIRARYSDVGYVKNRIEGGDYLYLENAFVTSLFEDAGYDGIYTYEKGEKNIGVYNADIVGVVKSATANIGTFDPQNADIRYRETEDKMTQKNRGELYKIVEKLGQEHSFLSGFAKQAREVYNKEFPDTKFRTPQLTEQGRTKVKKEYGKLSLPERKAVSRNITKILDKVLGKGNYNFNLVNQIKQNIKAVGAQYDNTIEILEGIPDSRDTALHETVHFVMRNTLTSQQRNQVFGLLKEQFGSEMDNVELEEIFAEGLIKWVNATDKQKAQMNFSDRVKAWFDKIIESMRKLFTNEDSVWNSVNDFYADLYSGKLKEQSGITEDIKTMFREVWHGSPHAIDKFMTKFMGTGEGAQAFGWGLYFTDVKDVGEWYAKSFFRTKQLSDKIKSKILKGITVENWTSKGEDIDLEYALWSELGDMKHEWTNDEVFDLAVTIAVSGRSHREITEVTHKALIKNKKKLEQYLEKNYLYKTNIWKNGNEDLLDWHGDVTKEQLNKIDKYTNERIKRKMYEQSLNLSGEKKPLSGSSLYRAIALALGTEREASLFLLRAGIDGIKYPAGTLSGSAKEGQYNYVVFDEKAIEILDKIQYRMRQNADIRYREVDDKMMTNGQRKHLHNLAGQFYGGEETHNRLSNLAKNVTGVTSMTQLTSEQFTMVKEALEDKIKNSQTPVQAIDAFLESRRQDRKRQTAEHIRNLKEDSLISGKDKAKVDIPDKNNPTLTMQAKEWSGIEHSQFEKKRAEVTRKAPIITRWIADNIGSKDFLQKVKSFEYYRDMVRFLSDYEKEISNITPDEALAIKTYLRSDSKLMPEELQGKTELQAMLVGIDKFKELDKERKGIRISSYEKVYDNFANLISKIAERSGVYELVEWSKKVQIGRTMYKEVFDIDSTKLAKSSGDTVASLSDRQKELIVVYMDTGNLAKEFEDNQAILRLIKDIDEIRIKDKEMITVARIKAGFRGKLWNGINKITGEKRHDYSESQWGFLLKAFAEQGNNYAKNNPAWEAWIKGVREGTVGGSSDFIKEHYIMGSKEAIQDMDMRILDEDTLFDSNNTDVNLGLGHLKSRKTERGVVFVEPIEQLLYAHRLALKAEYLSEAPNELNKLLEGILIDTDYKLVRKQLQKIVEIGEAKSAMAKAVALSMSQLYLGVVVSGGMPQIKNIFQFLLSVQNFSQLRDSLKIMTSNSVENLIVKKYGQEWTDRIKSETTMRVGINALSIAATQKTVTELKSKEQWKEGSKGAYLLANFFSNPLTELWNHNVGRNMLEFQQYLDRRNRMASFLLVSQQAERTFSKKNLTWKQVRDEMALTNMNKADQIYLSKVYANQGVSEFVFQLAKIKTEESQFQYDTALKSLLVSTGDTFIKQAFQYSTWWLSYQRRVHHDIKAAIFQRDRKAAVRALAFGAVNGIMAKVMIEILTGSLPGDDDDDYLNRIKASAIGFFDPTDWTGSWNMSTMIPLVSPFKIKGILAGDPNSDIEAGDVVSGQFGDLMLSMVNGVIGIFQLTLGSEEIRKSAGRRIAYNFERVGRQTFYPYILIERGLSLANGKKRMNIMRQIFDITGVTPYDSKDVEREWWQYFQYALAGKTARQLGKDSNTKSSSSEYKIQRPTSSRK